MVEWSLNARSVFYFYDKGLTGKSFPVDVRIHFCLASIRRHDGNMDVNFAAIAKTHMHRHCVLRIVAAASVNHTKPQ